MYYVYIIQSKIKHWHYVGLSKRPETRIKAHNSGKQKSTKAYKPFRLIYAKSFITRKKARDYEKFLKIRSNKEKLLRKLGCLD